ncbi:response regulator [Novosphingobium sp.]|uniref:response regulator n=1 Tax=Novosphingobium sp. TaxID=1874826 RepID=UPI0025D0E187|nr:response regulator [Novosphingobium sp.]
MLVPPRIFIVDDEALIAWNLVLEVEALGAEVIGPFHSVEESLQSAEASAPDLAILDINLHDKKVWPVAECLHAGGCPIVFVSADFDHAYIAAHFPQARMVHKPIGPGDLDVHISDLVGWP